MNLTTQYMGLELRSPIIVSANPLTEKVNNICAMEEAGAGAVVLHSLYEEQIRQERQALFHHLTHGTESFAEALTYFPEPDEYRAGTEGYLELIRKAKEVVNIPIIASLNGVTPGGWTSFARKMEEAGADALELNIYYIPTSLEMSGIEVEMTYIDILRMVKEVVSIPVAIKLSPFFSNMANMAKRLDDAGADALVLFNRFYQPDIDIEALEVKPSVLLSTPQALRLPLTWIGLLYGKIRAQMAATSGVHTGDDVVKLLLVGAQVTMVASAILRNGIGYLRSIEEGLRHWMHFHEYETIDQMRGAVSQLNAHDPSAFERAQYMKALIGFKPDSVR
ncbi:MAG: dihydroorotate dehydrogenase-like protein [Anaerolineae bacterium]|nr:dihydroorotate dehydrogenase-like protein [Anaerolineae bacterium]MDW8172078.1 dihydroorotate dehydrogenase-like protein [Anaerolineae bacterium]